mmetsp:Transcript_6781/g.16644  ORF Transcript_6781/g.16644 Transcript_6781/m.16644 type:complete len:484 (+) Transcript_6781:316-1767(+)
MGPTTVDDEPPLFLLGENDRVRLRTFMHGLFQNSKLPNRVDSLPRYDAKTLVKGGLLGKGTFSSVYKFRRGNLWNEDGSIETKSNIKSLNSKNDSDRRKRMVGLKNTWWLQQQLKKCWSSIRQDRSQPKFVVKTINKEILANENIELFILSVAYLAAEARILSGLDHKHVIHLYGWGSDSSYSSMIHGTDNEEIDDAMYQDRHFIVLERLERTLNQQFKDWELKRRRVAGSFNPGKRYTEDAKIIGATSVNHKFNRNRQIDFMNRLYNDRLLVAIQLSSAILYLHEKNVIHRDVKPQNIGFGKDGIVKLFDLGIAKEIILSGKTKTPVDPQHVGDGVGDKFYEQLYNLTGLAGSRPYMSPENGLRQSYNAKTDVYSFSMVLWELMTLRKLPHGRYSNAEIKNHVWMGPNHERPPLITVPEDAHLNLYTYENTGYHSVLILERSMRDLIRLCWSPIINERPTMKVVQEALAVHRSEVSSVVASG